MRNPLAGGREAAMKKFVKESGAMDAIAGIIASLELEILQEVDALHADFDLDYYGDLPDEDERKEQLKDLALHQMSDNLDGYYVKEVLDRHLQNPEKAKAYLNMDDEEWDDQIQQWASGYKRQAEQKGQDLDLSDRELAELHVENQFGVSIQKFEELVVEWTPGKVMEIVFAGNFSAVVDGVRYVRQQKADNDLDVEEPDLQGVNDAA